MRLFALLAASLATATAASAQTRISQKSGAWWGNIPTPTINQLWMQVDGVAPDATVSGNVSFNLTCSLPQPSTMRLTAVVLQVDGTNVRGVYNANAVATLGQARTFTVDTTRFLDGWHELRARCYAVETAVGPELGKQTQVTNGHQLRFRNGNALTDSHSVMPGVLDSHAWYDSDAATGDAIHYVYVQLLNVHPLIDAPIRGIVPITGRVSHAGATTIDHWVLKVDGVAVVELHGIDSLHTYNLDTRQFANGPHTLAFHGHGVARSGKQLAGQVAVPIVIQN